MVMRVVNNRALYQWLGGETYRLAHHEACCCGQVACGRAVGTGNNALEEYQVSFTGITNGSGCSNCNSLNGTYIVEYDNDNSTPDCTWWRGQFGQLQANPCGAGQVLVQVTFTLTLTGILISMINHAFLGGRTGNFFLDLEHPMNLLTFAPLTIPFANQDVALNCNYANATVVLSRI